MQRVMVITGSSGGIGSALCRFFSKKGWRVAGIDLLLPFEPIDGGTFYPADISDWEAVESVFFRIVQELGAPSVLINCGAISSYCKPLSELTSDEFMKVIGVNLGGTFNCSKAFAACRDNTSDYGRIVNIASTRWLQSEPHWESYAASKGGVVALTHSLAISLGGTGVTVNCISPGWIETQNYDSLTQEDHRQHPSDRVGRPDDVARAIDYLIDPLNDFVNGENIVLDGGMTKRMIYHE